MHSADYFMVRPRVRQCVVIWDGSPVKPGKHNVKVFYRNMLLFYLERRISAKECICNGSCIAHILRDFYASRKDRLLSDRLRKAISADLFIFVGDYLMLVLCHKKNLDNLMRQLLTIFNALLMPLTATAAGRREYPIS